MNLFQLCLLRGGLTLPYPWIISLHCPFTFLPKSCVNTSSTGYSGTVNPSLQNTACFLHRNIISSWTDCWILFPEKHNWTDLLKILPWCKIRTCKCLIFSQIFMLIKLLNLEIQFVISHQWIEKPFLLLLGKNLIVEWIMVSIELVCVKTDWGFQIRNYTDVLCEHNWLITQIQSSFAAVLRTYIEV